MISFEKFHMEEGTPIYVQILTYIRRGVAAGTITAGDELPSRRVLSALLGVNPNTVQKAYRILEEEGLMESRSGAKSYMVLDAVKEAKIRSELLESDMTAMITAMRQTGISKEEALSLIEAHWDDEGGGEDGADNKEGEGELK